MTPVEDTYVHHLKTNASAWRWTASEVMESARMYAELDPYQLSRLPELMQAEIDSRKAKKERV